MKQTRFTLGLMCLINAFACFFLVIAYILKDKKNTASPFLTLGAVFGMAGAALCAGRMKERYDDGLILDSMDDLCDDEEWMPHGDDIPLDETADEEEFSN
ncbi:MAG: hypothetical protein KBT31_03200 [Firmicutes bacterium]|nr:hypothetical protein [Candidatus Colimorpha enterica]